MKKFTTNHKIKLKQETQGRCGMCFYYPNDSIGLEIAHIIPRFKVIIDDEFNAISLCTRCHTIYDSAIISVLKTGYKKEDNWWKDQIKDQKILRKKQNKNYEDALKQIQLMREAKKKLLIQNGIFSHLELDILSGLFKFQEQRNIQLWSAKDHLQDIGKSVDIQNQIIDELYKEYGKSFFVKKEFPLDPPLSSSIKVFGLEIQYHDKIHFKNLIDRNFVSLKYYQSETLANGRNLIVSAGMTPKGEYAKPDRILLFYNANKDTDNFCDNLFQELKDVVRPYDKT